MLRIRNRVKGDGTDQPVLKGLDLEVPGESMVSVIGASGVGKSTLLRCINRLVEPSSGEIELNGVLLTGLKGGDLRLARRRIGLVFQSFNLVDRLTVMENRSEEHTSDLQSLMRITYAVFCVQKKTKEQ